MTSTPSPTERQRRLRAAPIGLVLLGWGLGVGPLAHAVLAHSEPLLHESGDRGWLQHASDKQGAAPLQHETALPHHHAPGALEHLQLALVAAAVTLALATLFLQLMGAELTFWRAPLLPRWHLPEIPGAP